MARQEGIMSKIVGLVFVLCVTSPAWAQVQRLQPMFPRGGVPPGWVGTWDYGTLPPTMRVPNGQVWIQQPYPVPRYRADPGAEGYRDGLGALGRQLEREEFGHEVGEFGDGGDEE